jgi:hypothetical protein
MATLRYILKFKIESNSGGKIKSILDKVIIVPSTLTGLDNNTMNKDVFIKILKAKQKGELVDSTYYFITNDNFKEKVCAFDINTTSDIDGNYSENFTEEGDNIVAFPINNMSGVASPTITIIDDTSVNVGSDLYNLDNGAIIKANVGGGKPKGGRTKRRKYRKKRKSKSSRKSRRKTAKK